MQKILKALLGVAMASVLMVGCNNNEDNDTNPPPESNTDISDNNDAND